MGKPMEKKKKKGRPSLLDLQKRSIRLQKQREQQKQKPNPNPNAIPNPYARFHNSSAGRCSARRNPIPEHKPASLSKDRAEAVAEASMEDDEDDDEPKQRRKEKKLKLVLHLPQSNTNSSDLTSCATELNGADSKKRVLDTMTKTEGKISVWKATEDPLVCPGGTSALGPTTPLPDKKLLNFILDRLQKKDIYGVFSEPVDPEELPDYLDIIKRPMDFSTVRKRLLDSAYKDLEHFEEDIFLISLNAMRYNSPDTIYFRQARSIHELAKKSFHNLRQESDGGNLEPKVVRRGRPPGTGKNGIKRPVGRPPSERTVSEFSSGASLANALNGNHSSSSSFFLRNDFHTKGSGLDQQRTADVSFRSVQFIPNSEAYIFNCRDKSERSEDYSGSTLNGFLNYGKKLAAMDDSRRNTYKQCRLLSSMSELPVLAALDGERKILFQVGFHINHAYARSLARFAANLGPIGWKIAAKRIEKVLPLGMKFGPGWIGDIDTHQSHFDHPQPFPPIHSSTQTNIAASSNSNQRSAKQEALPPNHFRAPPPSSASPIPNFAHQKFLPSLSGTLARQNSVSESFIGLEGGITVSSNSSSSSGHEFPPDDDRSFRPEINPEQDINLGILLPNPSKGLWPVVQVDSQQSDLLLQL